MALIHGIPTSVIAKMKTFGDLAAYQMTKLEKILQQINTTRVDMVYDTYDDSTMKYVEHETRADGKSPLIVNVHNESTKLPTQWPRYLSHSENKRKLIQFISHYVLNNIHVPKDKRLYLSGCFLNPTLCFSKDDTQTITEVWTLKSNHVEADTRMFLHVQHCLQEDERKKNVLIHSPDTDVFVLGIRFWDSFKQIGCQGLWLTVDVGAKKRSLSCHKAAEVLGNRLCEVLPALHCLTGCDTTSKIATKTSAFKYAKNHPEETCGILQLLNQRPLLDDSVKRLEALYLKLLRRKGQTCNESRYIQITTNPSAVKDISKMSCTSDSYKLHLLRCSAQLYYWENSLIAEIEPLDLSKYGFFKDSSGKLRPLLMELTPTPTALLQPCKCKNCSKATCSCFSGHSSCCSYCKCYGNCKNPKKPVSYMEDEDEIEHDSL